MGIVKEVRLQPEKAAYPMLITELGIVKEVRLQPENAKSPMPVTELGIVKEVRLQPEKAPSPMLVTELGIIVFILPATSIFVSVSMMALQSSRESYFAFPLSTVIEVRSQPENALFPMLFTELGIVKEVRPLQPEKALSPIETTEFGIAIADRSFMPRKAS